MATSLRWLLLVLLPSVAVGKDYYTAAVFEHRPRGEPPEEPIDIITSNLQFYEKAAVLAAEKGADIIVFNEFGLFPYVKNREALKKFMEYVPDPRKTLFNPCIQQPENSIILNTLSCMARNNHLYVVANMGDVQPCEGNCDAEVESCAAKCPPDNLFMYNTDVAFDREGNIVAKYHKVHPYFELFINYPEEPEYVTFQTDFGVFGMIVCFDSVFKESVILSEMDIDTLLFPTAWFDDIVPFNAAEWQQSWALANQVHFLAAGSQKPGLGMLGSGIFSKYDGALVYTYNPDGESKLLVANVKLRNDVVVDINPSLTVVTETSYFPKEETGDNFPEHCYNKLVGNATNEYTDYRCFTSQTEGYTLVKLTKSSGHVEACNNGFCCSLSYATNDMKEDFYLVAINGSNNVKDYYHWCEETCMLVRCDPFEEKPCALLPSHSNTVFESLELEGEFTAQRIYATVSKDKHRLALKSEWQYRVEGHEANLEFRSKDNRPLLKAGFLGRCYQRDPPFVPFYQY